MKNDGVVTIVVTTKNEERDIRALLESLRAQSYGNLETIVVDNNSADQTEKIAEEYTDLVFSFGPERSAQRNFGAKKSHGEIIIFLDADMRLTETVVEECVHLLENQSIQSVVIPERSIGQGFWSECKAFERSFYLGIDWIESARCFRRTALKTVGGYDETMSGPEDFDLAQRMVSQFGDKAVGRIHSFIIHNEGRIRIWELLKRKFYYGKSLRSYANKKHNKGFHSKQGSVFYRYGVFFAKPMKLFSHPLLALGMLLMKTGELSALAIGRIVG